LLGLSVIAMTMTHPKNIVRLKQALAHTRIVIGRAEAASELELMRAQAVVEQARLDRQRERTRRESEYLIEVEKLIGLEERKRAMVSAISDPTLREALARELGVDPNGFPSELDAGARSGRNHPRFDNSREASHARNIASQESGEASQDGLKALQEVCSEISFRTPGKWFAVELRPDHVRIRQRTRVDGREETLKTARLTLEVLRDVLTTERSAFRARLESFLKKRGFEL
jgi:hypothetical protein